MKSKEIIERIKNGEKVTLQEHAIVKRGKVKRGCTYSYKVGDDPITKTQFEAVRPILGKSLTNSLSTRIYQHFMFNL